MPAPCAAVSAGRRAIRLNHNLYLLVPLLLPAAGAAALCVAGPHLRSQQRRRFLAALLALELIYALLAQSIHGSCVLAAAGPVRLTLAADSVSHLFAALFAGLLAAAGLARFGVSDTAAPARDVLCLAALTALQGLCYAGDLLTFDLFFLLLAGLALPLTRPFGKGRAAAWAAALGAAVFAVLCGSAVFARYAPGLAFQAGGGLDGTAAENAGPLQAAAGCLLLGFGGLAALLPPAARFEGRRSAPALAAGLFPCAGILGVLRAVYYLFGSRFFAALPLRGLLAGAAAAVMLLGGVLACLTASMERKLACLAVSHSGAAVWGLLLVRSTAFWGALLHTVIQAAALVCLYLCAGLLYSGAGKADARSLRGAGRQMPVVMGCFAAAALGLTGLPSLVGVSACGFLPAWGPGLSGRESAGAAALALAALLTLCSLLPAGFRAFFPGRDFDADARVPVASYTTAALLGLAAALLAAGLFPLGLIQYLRVIAVTILP